MSGWAVMWLLWWTGAVIQWLRDLDSILCSTTDFPSDWGPAPYSVWGGLACTTQPCAEILGLVSAKV